MASMAKLTALAAVLALVLAGAAAAQAPAVPDSKIFDPDLGWYQLGPRVVLHVWRDDGHDFVRLGPGPAVEVVPSGPDALKIKGGDAEFTFPRDASGGVTGFVLHQKGGQLSGPRITEATAKSLTAEFDLPHTWTRLSASAPRFITQDPGLDQWPVFSPDGRKVLFAHSADGRNFSLMTVPAAGGPAEPFLKSPPPLSTDRPNWSRRTGQVAFTAEQGGTAAIWVASAEGGGAHALTAAGLSDQMYYPSWAPDGRSVVAMDGKALALKRAPVDGGAAKTLTDPKSVFTGMPNVSPDGAWVAFAGQANAGKPYDQTQNIIWLLGPDGAVKPLEAQPHDGRGPSWSPDGRQVAFESDRGSPTGLYAIFVAGRDGSGLAQVTDYIGASHPVYSPDGKHMVFDAPSALGQPPRIAIVDLP
jgi:dipeptidyl aminopeptidase/acylaminoacyl peptidase